MTSGLHTATLYLVIGPYSIKAFGSLRAC